MTDVQYDVNKVDTIVSLWLYCHLFGVNSCSVAVIATGYPVSIAIQSFHGLSVIIMLRNLKAIATQHVGNLRQPMILYR